MKSKTQQIGAILLFTLAYGYLIFFPKEASSAVADGLRLSGTVVLPSLFPYFVLTNCVVSSGLVRRFASRFRANCDDVCAFLLGVLGGYPLGAKTLATSIKKALLSEPDAAKLLPLCNNAGAALFLSMIGGKLFGSLRLGATLFLIHILSALIIRLFFRTTGVAQNCLDAKQAASFHFAASVHDAAMTALTVCAFIVVFSVITQAANRITANIPTLSVLISGFLELSGGCYAAAIADFPLCLRASLCSLFAGWGGLCVHAQTVAIFGDARIPLNRYLAVKALHGILAFLLTMLLFASSSPLMPILTISIFFLLSLKIPLEKNNLIRYNRKKLRRV